MSAALKLASPIAEADPLVALPASSFWEFLLRYGRPPMIGDTPEPWEYRGWLLYYVQQIHVSHAGVTNRWGYHLRTLQAGRLLDEPIPQIHFLSSGDAGARENLKLLDRWIGIVDVHVGGWSSFLQFVDWLAWGLGVSSEAPDFSPMLNERLYREVNIGTLLTHPHDYLGTKLCDRHSRGWNPNVFYPTPHNVVELMTRITMGAEEVTLPDGRDARRRTVCDPCVGTGRMLMHASNYSLCLYGQDIDATVCKITKINGALYVPWMSFPLPESIVGSPQPPPPPAPLPVSESHQPPAGWEVHRADDRGQGLLFNIR